MKKILSLLFLLQSINLLCQQETHTKQNSFGLSLALNQIKEENLHPKVHRGVAYGLYYYHEKTKNHLPCYELNFQFSKIKTVFEEASTTMNIQFAARYAYLINLQKNTQQHFYIGPELAANYSLNYYPKWDDSHLYWADDFALGVASKLKKQLSDNNVLTFDLGLSLFALLSRPEFNRAYKIDDVSFGAILKNMNSHFEAGTFNKVITLHFKTAYQFKISKKITQMLCFAIKYRRLKTADGKPFQNLQYSFGIHLVIKKMVA